MTGAPERLCFVHIMKTGGWSFDAAVKAALAPEEVWAVDGDGDMLVGSNMSLDLLEQTPATATRRVRYVAGHFPLSATALLDPPPVVATMLRHPVDRTLSYLRHCTRDHAEHRGLPLEEIYEDRWFFERFIENHQTKVLSMTLDEARTPSPPITAPSGFSPEEATAMLAGTATLALAIADPPIGRLIPLDDARLDVAKRAAEDIDVVGLQEDHAGFVAAVAHRMGWTLDPELRANVGPTIEAPESLRRRIEDDNTLDMELYHHVRTHVVGVPGT